MSNQIKIDIDDARAWGREAFEMGLSLAEAQRQIRECGCPDRLLADVAATYERVRANAMHQEG